ncbi:MAG: SRPBCC domain-containing protein [Phycisphaerales bacterium]|nr:SRPBCC domain-containing protein [Phycisphaerales bacterium]
MIWRIGGFPELAQLDAAERRAVLARLRWWVYPFIVIRAIVVGALVGGLLLGATGWMFDYRGGWFVAVAYPALGAGVAVAMYLHQLGVIRDDLRKELRASALKGHRTVCLACGYDLRGSNATRCPECGAALIMATKRPSAERGPAAAAIHHDFPISAPAKDVFEAISTPGGLDAWWTRRCAGEVREGSEYVLDFGPGYVWRAIVSACEVGRMFELSMVHADDDWIGSRVCFELSPIEGGTQVRFSHTGWPELNDHFRTSSFCWAMYLRLMKRYVEQGEIVPYERRLDA